MAVGAIWAGEFKKLPATGIFQHNHLYSLRIMVWKGENIQ